MRELITLTKNQVKEGQKYYELMYVYLNEPKFVNENYERLEKQLQILKEMSENYDSATNEIIEKIEENTS